MHYATIVHHPGPLHPLPPPLRGRPGRRAGGGFAGLPGTLKVARAALHFWEEPCISGTAAAGTVFFSGCALKCCYCQN